MSAPKAMEREFYRTERVAEGVTRIRCSVGELCYLVEGEKSAALIDAASGYAGLRELVASLTDKPVRLFLTHGHRDHSGGMVQFEQAWAHAGVAAGHSLCPVDPAVNVLGRAHGAGGGSAAPRGWSIGGGWRRAV